MVEWIDLDELLDKSIGDIREMLAHEDSDSSFRTFLIENGWIEDIDNEYDDNDDYEEDENNYDDDDYEDDEEDSWDDDDEEEDVELPSDQEELAKEIAEDISNKKYSIESLYGLYGEDFIKRIKKLID